MKKLICLILCLSSLAVYSQTFKLKDYQQDFDYFWQSINDNYCYFSKKGIDWKSLRATYQSEIDTVTSRNAFIGILEKVLNELHDHHSSLNTNTPFSRRLVPTGADLWAEYVGDLPIITEVRRNFAPDKLGIKAGMQVVMVNDVKVEDAIRPFLAHTITAESKSYALRLLLAGDHRTPRKLTVKTDKGLEDFYPDQQGMMLENISYPAMVEGADLQGIGYLKINNFLYDNALIAKFDSVLNTLLQKKALIIDLRETPSGGNTSVARAILGRFITKDHFYQKHEYYAEEKETGIKRSWIEIVSPRGQTYTKPLVVLADHWTGSIAEGITIAFDGMKRATVVGTQLARLNGAVESFNMPNTKIRFNIATERLYHVNGTPREFYQPTVKVDMTKQQPGKDLILTTALQFLQQKIK
ncbi:MAG: S41 family peptidase [Pedobacter sp.]|nr:S41 family peptidase [Pedobacter sp.]MDQ8054328.1 S41 family peptidase [Pedobacter sp.]